MRDTHMDIDPVKNGMSQILGYNPENDMIYATAVGIMSNVRKRTSDGTGKTIGHVTMLDIEDTTLATVKEYSKKHLDAYFIFGSSKDNFHVLDVVIRSKAEMNELMKAIPLEDSKHRRIGLDQPGLTLRISEKGYKSRPVLLESHADVIGAKDKNRVLSKPHLVFLYEYYNNSVAESLKSHPKAIGDGIQNVIYQTIHKNGER